MAKKTASAPVSPRKSRKKDASLPDFTFGITVAGHPFRTCIPCDDGVEAVSIAYLIAKEVKQPVVLSACDPDRCLGTVTVKGELLPAAGNGVKRGRGRPKKEEATDAPEA